MRNNRSKQPPKWLSTRNAFFLLILIFTFISTGFLVLHLDLPGTLIPSAVHPNNYRIVLWNVKDPSDEWGTLLGKALTKHTTTTLSCPFNCTYTTYPLNDDMIIKLCGKLLSIWSLNGSLIVSK